MKIMSATRDARRIRVGDLPLRLFHWLLVAAVAIAFLSSEEDSVLNQWHVMSGWIAGILILFRIAWGFVGGEHSRFADFVRPAGLAHHLRGLVRGRPEATVGHNALGALSVLVLLALVAATVATGITLGEELHEVLAWTMLALVAVHVLAVVVMSILTRESLVRAMITGTKPVQRHPGSRDARRPHALGLLIAGLVVLGSVYAVFAYDPLAFSPRSTEAYERRAAGGDYDVRTEPRRAGAED